MVLFCNFKIAASALLEVLAWEAVFLALTAKKLPPPPQPSLDLCAPGPSFYETILQLLYFAGMAMLASAALTWLVLNHVAFAGGSLKKVRSSVERAALRLLLLLLAIALAAAAVVLELLAQAYVLQVRVATVASCFSGVMKALLYYYVLPALTVLVCGTLFCALAVAAIWGH